MQAKMDQLLHHREELCFDEVSPDNSAEVRLLPSWLDFSFFFPQVEKKRLGSFFLERSSSLKSEYVTNSIMDYSGWLRKRIHPTDSEVIVLHKP